MAETESGHGANLTGNNRATMKYLNAQRGRTRERLVVPPEPPRQSPQAIGHAGASSSYFSSFTRMFLK